MSVKDCGNHHHEDRRKAGRRVLLVGGGVALAFAVIVLIIWGVLHPSGPRFILQDLAVYNFTSVGAPPFSVTTILQATISSRNPNDRIGIYYRRLDALAVYRGQQITAATLLPESYQGHRDISVWSPVLYGVAVPMSPYLQPALAQDLSIGAVLLDVKVVGKVRWKVGSWVSGEYRLDVNCPAYLRFADAPPPIRTQLVQRCHVETAMAD